MNSTSDQAMKETLAAFLKDFIGGNQKLCLRDLLRGEEAAFFREKMQELAVLVLTMPATYETENTGKNDKVVMLHYFTGGADFWIIEKDSDPDGRGQIQAFGFADLGYGPELGYISIKEILEAGAELDFHFTPKTWIEVSEKRKSA